MEEAAGQDWFLRKHEDGSIFGPLPFAQLARWASSAQVAPHDVVSTDQVTWIKAPMLAELEMDWLVEVTTERLNTISKLFDSAELQPKVGSVLPLKEVRTAHEMLAGAPHKRGKIVLRV